MNNQPTPCDSYIYNNGNEICFVTGRSFVIENWIVQIRKLSGQQVDWHYVGGRGRILYIGDYDKILKAINTIEHDGVNIYHLCSEE